MQVICISRGTAKAGKIAEKLAEELGYDISLLNSATAELSKIRLGEMLRTDDSSIIQAINALDDLENIENLFSERLFEWTCIFSPDNRKNTLKAFRDVLKKMEEEEERDLLKKYVEKLQTVVDLRKETEKYIQKNMERIAPNVSTVVGPLIGARLIALAGGFERLATLPSSTIQLIGAEKAFFRYKKEGGKPPKHGIIFQHPYLHSVPRNLRGKTARALASKITVAVKVDYYKGEFIGDKLKADLKVKVECIKNRA